MNNSPETYNTVTVVVKHIILLLFFVRNSWGLYPSCGYSWLFLFVQPFEPPLSGGDVCIPKSCVTCVVGGGGGGL